MSLHIMILYIPMFNTVFQICPLSLEEWLAVIKISLPVILLDELLKFIARRYIDLKNRFIIEYIMSHFIKQEKGQEIHCVL
ncbi:unnamed protein product [Rotaria socialis]|nr:unnamed protein product [Rotaria socialis]